MCIYAYMSLLDDGKREFWGAFSSLRLKGRLGGEQGLSAVHPPALVQLTLF